MSNPILSGPILNHDPNPVAAARAMWRHKYGGNEKNESSKWERELEIRDDWRFWQDDGMEFMAILVDTENQQCWMTQQTHAVIVDDVAADVQLSLDLERWGSGMKYLVTEAGKYGEAARAALPDEPVVKLVDPAKLIEQDANALLVQVAHLNRDPSESQIRLFAERLGDVRARHQALLAQLEDIGETINLAAVAVVDSQD